MRKVYEKLVDNSTHLFCSQTGIPTEDDAQLSCVGESGDVVDVDIKKDKFLDDKNGGITIIKDGAEVDVIVTAGDSVLIPEAMSKITFVSKPTADVTEYLYTGEEIELQLDGFDSDIMSVSGNKSTEPGNYTAIISLKDKDKYNWEDFTSNDVLIPWTIKPTPAILDRFTVNYMAKSFSMELV